MRFRMIRLIPIFAIVTGVIGVGMVSADCQGATTSGDDTIVCDNTPLPPNGYLVDPVNGGAGNDTIVVEADTMIANTVVGDPYGVAGDDTIIIEGSVQDVIGGQGNDTIIIGPDSTIYSSGEVYGDIPYSVTGGDDTIIVEGTVEGAIQGNGGNDTIIISGTIWFGVDTGDGDDTIVLQDGATGNPNGNLWIYGQNGNDTLVFDLTINNQFTYDTLLQLINDGVSSGWIEVNGVTYSWANMEQLIGILRLVLMDEFADERLNPDPAATAVLYCHPNQAGVYALSPLGEPLFSIPQEQIDGAINSAASAGSNEMIADTSGQSIWALSSNELQLHSDAGNYDYIFPADTCASSS